MAAMSTALTVFSDNGNTRTFTISGHLVTKPRIVIQTRKVPLGNAVIQESKLSVIYATTDSGGAVIPERTSFQAVFRSPVTGNAAEVTAALAVFRDIVASDEFTAMTTTQNFVKN
jgi:hypothetical protein